MSHQKYIISDMDVLQVKLQGTIDLPERNEIRDEVVGICREKELGRILVDVRELDSARSLIDLYDFGSTFVEGELPFDVKIACVCHPEESESVFPVTIAKKKLINISAFQDAGDAIRWLTQ